jgi:hypothetical protein
MLRSSYHYLLRYGVDVSGSTLTSNQIFRIKKLGLVFGGHAFFRHLSLDNAAYALTCFPNLYKHLLLLALLSCSFYQAPELFYHGPGSSRVQSS